MGKNIKMNFKVTGREHSCVLLDGRSGSGGDVRLIFFGVLMVSFTE